MRLQWSHAEQETIRKQFPVAMLHQCPTPDGKLSANSFLPPCSSIVSCWTRNYPPIVSCRHAPPMVPSRTGNFSQVVSHHHAPPLSHAALSFRAQRSGAEKSPAEQFSAAMLHQCPMPHRKLSANSFLPLCSTTAPCQTGNYPRTVSCRYAPPLPHAGWETIRKQFPAAMLRHCPTPDGKP